jgi:phosphatidylinositol 3-kinase
VSCLRLQHLRSPRPAQAFNLLRKSSGLMTNLFTLMVDANIHDLSSEHDIVKLQERFRLDLNDEEAVQFFQQVINDSVSALFPQVTETIHRWAQYWRS